MSRDSNGLATGNLRPCNFVSQFGILHLERMSGAGCNDVNYHVLWTVGLDVLQVSQATGHIIRHLDVV
jgi:hypothetical protein